jgi:ribosomal protein L37AE/L43A
MPSACPKGHESSEPDFCSECGAKIAGASVTLTSAAAPAPQPTGELCPDCSAPRDSSSSIFCEICGHNFATGARGQIPVATPVAPPAPAAIATAQSWSVEISVDAALRTEGSPEPPANFAPSTIELRAGASLIGRTSAARAIFPELALDHDDAVSHRHALLTRNADGSLLLRDIGSSNGTRLNAKDVEALTDVALKDGDAITLGHWTRILIKGA